MSETGDSPAIQLAKFSEIVGQDDADELLLQLTDDMLIDFAAKLDQSEADSIWAAANDFGIQFYSGPDCLIHRLAQLTASRHPGAWKKFHAALIQLSSARYIEWCLARIESIDISQTGNDAVIELLDEVLPLLVATVAHDEACKLVNAVLDLKCIDTKFKFLNLIAGITLADGRANPIVAFARDGDPRLAHAIAYFWEDSFNRTGTKTSGLWTDNIDWGYLRVLPPAIKLVGSHCPGMTMLGAGYSAGIRASTMGDVQDVLDRLHGGSRHPEFAPMGTLWYFLKQLSVLRGSDNDTERSGVRAGLLALVKRDPELWVKALRWILLHAEAIKQDVTLISCELAQTNEEVRNGLRVLQADPAVSTLAMGIRALAEGIVDPADKHSLALADSLAHYFDGTPKFPSPLALRSSTWVGSDRLEKYLRDGVARACHKFAVDVPNQWKSQEEALTATLMTLLVEQFGESRKLSTYARSEAFGIPTLRLSQREISKSAEEPTYGCDLAFVVRARAQGIYALDWAGLVQVKKTLAGNENAAIADSWKIEIAQLKTLIGKCASAVYFLICGHGEVLVVPARHLLGYVAGSSKKGAKSRTVGYNEIRSAAIPLDQYLVDLLIGQWTGNASDAIMTFIDGNSGLRPKHVVQVEIHFSPRQ